MRKPQSVLTTIAAACGMFILILDCEAAFQGAYEGIDLCIRTVIPSLFPFFVLSSVLSSRLNGISSKHLRWIGKILRIPAGSEILWLTGLIGGYPTGAKCVAEAYDAGNLTKKDAGRLLGFCSNAGPAFIFGMTVSFFPQKIYPCAFFLIQVVSSFLTGYVLPGESEHTKEAKEITPIGWSKSVYHALRAIAGVCGWIVLFRVVLHVCNRWFFWLLPSPIVVMISGILELTNGIIELSNIPSVPMRFVLCAFMLNFGGICVVMQTAAVTGNLGIRTYLTGKCIQTYFSILISVLFCGLIFHHSFGSLIVPIILTIASVSLIRRKQKITVAFVPKLVYNKEKST